MKASRYGQLLRVIASDRAENLVDKQGLSRAEGNLRRIGESDEHVRSATLADSSKEPGVRLVMCRTSGYQTPVRNYGAGGCRVDPEVAQLTEIQVLQRSLQAVVHEREYPAEEGAAEDVGRGFRTASMRQGREWRRRRRWLRRRRRWCAASPCRPRRGGCAGKARLAGDTHRTAVLPGTVFVSSVGG